MANVNRLKQVRMAIVNFEENFNYRNYFANKGSITRNIPVKDVNTPELFTHTCGTSACVAGFAVALYNPEPEEIKEHDDPWDIAEKWLGLTFTESEWLFTPYHNWNPSHVDSLRDYKDVDESEFPGYISCTQEQGYAEALRRLDHLIEYYSNANSN